MAHQPTDVPDRSLDSDRPSRVWLTAVLRPAGTLADAFADAVAQTIDELSRTADMVVVDLEAAQIPDAEAVADRLRPPAARLASVGKCCSCSTSPRRWCMPSRQQMCPPWPCPPTSILDGPVAALDVLPSPGGDLVDAGDQLAQVAHLKHLVAVGGVGTHDRVAGVPLVLRLGVEPVEVADATG
jgi:hypothetical protein